MSIEDGARLARHRRGEFAEGELPATSTAVQRARLRHRADRGDLAAEEALARYAKAQQAAVHTELTELRNQTEDQ